MNPRKSDRRPRYEHVRLVLVKRERRYERPWQGLVLDWRKAGRTWQGLVLDWRKAGRTWQALVVYIDDRATDAGIRTDWIAGDRLRPVHIDPNPRRDAWF